MDEGTATIYCVVYDNTTYGKFEATCEVTVIKESSGNVPGGNPEDVIGKTYIFEDMYYEGIDEHPYRDMLISSLGAGKKSNEGSTIIFAANGTFTAYSPYLDMTIVGTYTVENGKVIATSSTEGAVAISEYIIQGDTLVNKYDMSEAMGSVGSAYQEMYKGVIMVTVYKLQA